MHQLHLFSQIVVQRGRQHLKTQKKHLQKAQHEASLLVSVLHFSPQKDARSAERGQERQGGEEERREDRGVENSGSQKKQVRKRDQKRVEKQKRHQKRDYVRSVVDVHYELPRVIVIQVLKRSLAKDVVVVPPLRVFQNVKCVCDFYELAAFSCVHVRVVLKNEPLVGRGDISRRRRPRNLQNFVKSHWGCFEARCLFSIGLF